MNLEQGDLTACTTSGGIYWLLFRVQFSAQNQEMKNTSCLVKDSTVIKS